MIKYAITLLFISLFFLSSFFTGHGGLVPTNQLVYELGSPGTSWLDRQKVEERLKQLPSDEVLPILLLEVAKGMPDGPIWSSAGPNHDKNAPPEWQAYYAVYRVWKYHLKGVPSQVMGELLLTLLKEANTPAAKIMVIDGLFRHWISKAEKPIAELLQDSSEDYTVRWSSAQVLLRHIGIAYHNKVLEMVKSESGQSKYRLFVLLVEPPYAKQSGVDSDVVCLGFGMIEEERKADPDYNSTAYFIARYLETYLSQRFAPDQYLKKYQDKHGLNDSFFRDTVDNALKWWTENMQKYNKEK
jgi:hypothetical protein